MSADWKAGDRALCISSSAEEDEAGFINGNAPKKGVIYIVTDVHAGTARDGPSIGLRLAGCATYIKKKFLCFGYKGDEAWFDHRLFRKIVPACDRLTQEQTTELPVGRWSGGKEGA